jgi:DNA helicase II / ATP-dependent DNA helicase PcrA
LCYVGMTRAKDRLTLSLSSSRRSYGEEGRRTTRRSRFLAEIPAEFTERLNGSIKPQTRWEGAINSRESIERFLGANNFSERLDSRRPAPSKPQANGKWKRGSQVRHAKYGLGTILACEGEGDDEKLTVSFPGYGAKKLIPRFASLEKA